MWIAYAVVAVAVVVANIIVRARGVSWPAFILKVASGLLFCSLGVDGTVTIATRFADPARGRLLVLGVLFCVGLGLGLLGDVALALRDLLPGHDTLMMIGFGLFMVGHLAYIAGLAITWSTPFPWLPVIVCAVLGVPYVVFDVKYRLHFGKLRPVVGVYTFLVLMLPAMGFFAAITGTHPSGPGFLPQPLVVGLVGIAFVVSDLILGWSNFGESRNRPWEHATCYIFYYIAQFGLAASLFLV